MIQELTEDEFFSEWYDWKLVDDDYRDEVEPEEMVAINRGFGNSKKQISAIGEPEWNKKTKRFEFSDIKVEMSGRIQCFENDFKLYKITDLTSLDSKSKKILMKKTDKPTRTQGVDLYVLDDTNVPIYSANNKAGVLLDSMEKIKSYLIFFFLNVRGRHGRFYPIADISQLDTLISFNSRYPRKEYLSAKHEEVVKHFGEDVHLEIRNQFISEAANEIVIKNFYVVFQSTLFSTTVTIQKNSGVIALSDEKDLITF